MAGLPSDEIFLLLNISTFYGQALYPAMFKRNKEKRHLLS